MEHEKMKRAVNPLGLIILLSYPIMGLKAGSNPLDIQHWEQIENLDILYMLSTAYEEKFYNKLLFKESGCKLLYNHR